MRKILSLLFVIVLIVSLTSCTESVPSVDYSGDIKLNFSTQGMQYLKTIGTEYTKREIEGENSTDHDKCADWIIKELKKSQYTDDEIFVDNFELYNHKCKNIIVTVEGKNPNKQIIIGSHYDGTGVGDNGSGIALLLANICGLRNEKPDVTVKYVFFDGEEIGFLGSSHFANSMSKDEIKNTLFMLNIDSIAFGDYCNVYGGTTKGSKVRDVKGYDLAMDRAKQLGIETYKTEDLDGFYQRNGKQPEIKDNALYSNPWTKNNPTPNGYSEYISPSTGGWSDHQPFVNKGITYIYFEAGNWYMGDLYNGSVETSQTDIGDNGVIMNTQYDTFEALNKYFPNRAENHFKTYSPLLSSLILHSE